MSHYEARMTSKGQITIPSGVRDWFGLKAGDIVDFYVDDTARSVEIVARNKPVSALFGALNGDIDRADVALTPADIDKAISDHLAEEDQRITRQGRERQEFEAWKRARKVDAAE